MNLTDLDTFERVAAHGTLAAAARELGVPKSTVSRRLSRLEEAVGTDLLHRGPRRVTLTRAGEELFARSAAPLSELRELDAGLVEDAPRGVLRLTAPYDLGTNPWLAEMLARFRRLHPGITFEVNLGARIVDLIGEGYDVAIRAQSAMPDTDDLAMRTLTRVDSAVFASRRYLQERPTPQTVADLDEHDLVTLQAFADRPVRLFDADGGEHLARPPVVATGTDLGFVASMVRAGMGVGVLPFLGEDADLVRLLPELHGPPAAVALVWPRRRFLLPRVRAFVDYAVAEFATFRQAF